MSLESSYARIFRDDDTWNGVSVYSDPAEYCPGEAPKKMSSFRVRTTRKGLQTKLPFGTSSNLFHHHVPTCRLLSRSAECANPRRHTVQCAGELLCLLNLFHHHASPCPVLSPSAECARPRRHTVQCAGSDSDLALPFTGKFLSWSRCDSDASECHGGGEVT
jgi:hypothetical protein